MRDLNEPTPVNQAAFEAMMRRYLMKVGGRYVPVVAVAAAVALVLVFVPTKNSTGTQTAGGGNLASGNSSGVGANGTSGAAQGAGSVGGAGGSGGPTAAQTGGGASSAGGGGAGTSAGAGGGAGGGGGTSGSNQGSSGAGANGGGAAAVNITPVNSTSSNLVGTAKTGAACGNGARQFTWSEYAPYCVPAFHGANGGATASGVTGNTITLTYRLANSAQQTAIDSLAGAANINQDDLVKDLESYVNYFNTQFELYGRHVVLKTFQGQGDYIEEDQGQDLAATQADAVTAHDLGSFGDVTFSLESSQYYTQDLAQEHVISFSGIGMSQQWFQQYAPYEYSVQGPSGTNSTQMTSDLVCARLAGMNAEFAGSPTLTTKKRVFGVIYPETPVYESEVNAWEPQMQKQCGVKVAQTEAYAINVANYEEESANILAKMDAKGVTTILSACDPIADIFLSDSANSEQYYPEWLASYFGDPIGRNYNQTVWSHVMTAGFEWPNYTAVEPYNTFERAYPGQQPAEVPPGSPRYYYSPYYTLLQVFDALQAAGPDLNPNTFEQGMFSLPPSQPGDFIAGQWKFGQNVFDPIVSYSLAYWSPNTVSNFDDTKGAYLWCNNAQTYTLADPAALGTGQLHCFGK